MKHWIAVSLMVALAAGAGCGSDGGKVDLGDDKVAKTGEKLSDYAGNWHGYAEAFQFDGDSDAIAIKLDAHGEGVIEFGEADPLPPPKADETYPPHVGGMPAGDEKLQLIIRGELISGFSYPISGAVVESKRIRFEISTGEVVREWCELQIPVRTRDSSGAEYWACAPADAHGTADGCFADADESMTLPCAKLTCDMYLCTCTESSCEPNAGDNVRFDAALQSDGEELVGTLAVGVAARISVHLTLQ
jgi:hypothetical protein